MWLETECAGVVSEPLPLVLVSDLDIAEEIESMREPSTGQDLQELAVDSLLVDIGMTLQYAAHIFGTSSPQQQSGKQFST